MEEFEPLSVPFLYWYKDLVISRKRIREVKTNPCEVQIAAGTTFQLPIVITDPNTELQWGFVVEYYDIDFEIKMETGLDEYDTILEHTTYLGQIYNHGVISLEKPGTYYMIWDNKRSWIRGKTISYQYTLTLPEITNEERNQCSRYAMSFVIWYDNDMMYREVLADQMKSQQIVMECDQIKCEKEDEITVIRTLSNKCTAKRILVEVRNVFFKA